MNRKYTQEHVDYIAANIQGCPFKELTDKFNERFGMNLGVSAMISLADRHGLHNGRDTRLDSWLATAGIKYRFPKGHVPANKGVKGFSYPGMVATQYKKGHKPANWMPMGSERVNGDGYIDVKTQDGKLQKNWKGKHLIVWEEANGPVPKGHAVIFADGNRLNVVLENLILVSRGKLAVMNKRGLIAQDADLTKTGAIIADVYLKIGQRKKTKKGAKT